MKNTPLDLLHHFLLCVFEYCCPNDKIVGLRVLKDYEIKGFFFFSSTQLFLPGSMDKR